MFSAIFFLIVCAGLILAAQEIKHSKLSPYDKKFSIGFFMLFLFLITFLNQHYSTEEPKLTSILENQIAIENLDQLSNEINYLKRNISLDPCYKSLPLFSNLTT